MAGAYTLTVTLPYKPLLGAVTDTMGLITAATKYVDMRGVAVKATRALPSALVSLLATGMLPSGM